MDGASIHVVKAISPVALPGRTSPNKKASSVETVQGEKVQPRRHHVHSTICFASKKRVKCLLQPAQLLKQVLTILVQELIHLTKLCCSKCRKQVLQPEQGYCNGLGSGVIQFRQISL